MYGEPSRIREVAERLERRAEQLRAEADELHAASETTAWTSLAADRMREQARARRDEIRGVAREYDEAAQRVRAHAAEVQRLLDLIATIERQVRSIISDALGRINDALSSIASGIKDALTPGDEDDRRIAQTPTPPSGHKDWLDMPDLVPGVRL
jgi:chromosome segregation ATPase